MNDVMEINSKKITVKEYNGERVVTFKDIDAVHSRPDGTARKRFNDNRKRFIEGEDFFKLSPSEFRTQFDSCLSRQVVEDITIITESGYLMLVKSFTDNLAWEVQRQLVNFYFQKTVKPPTVPFREQLEAAAFIAADLRVNDVSKLMMYQKLCESNHVSPDFLPDYAADTGREKKPITELLKQYQIPMTAAKFNQLLIAAGILEERERFSTTGKNGKKKFKALTEKGTEYGENLVSKYNPKQTQPYYYVDTFQKLCQIVSEQGVLL